jgi:hypothetical protein
MDTITLPRTFQMKHQEDGDQYTKLFYILIQRKSFLGLLVQPI